MNIFASIAVVVFFSSFVFNLQDYLSSNRLERLCTFFFHLFINKLHWELLYYRNCTVLDYGYDSERRSSFNPLGGQETFSHDE